MMQAEALQGGFQDAPIQSAHGFRGAMRAMARPGTIEEVMGAVPPAPMSVAAGTLALVLLDQTSPVYLAGDHDCSAVRDWITFHTGAPLVGAAEAHFAFGTWEALAPLGAYAIGTSEYPDRSATLIVEMDALEAQGATLRGPGIKNAAALSLPEIEAFQRNARLFPLGLDFYFTHGAHLAALPRTTRVEG